MRHRPFSFKPPLRPTPSTLPPLRRATACCTRCPAPQYRMHPCIREFPSLNFYGGSLKDGPSVLQARAVAGAAGRGRGVRAARQRFGVLPRTPLGLLSSWECFP